MAQAAVLDRTETVAWAVEFLVHLIDTDGWSADAALDAACALAELFEPKAIVGYTTIDSHGPVPTFQTALYPRLPTWQFSKVHGVPIKRPYVGTCAQAICEGRIIASNIATETRSTPLGVRPAPSSASARSSPLLYLALTAAPSARL
jgi:hypothetical protein